MRHALRAAWRIDVAASPDIKDLPELARQGIIPATSWIGGPIPPAAGEPAAWRKQMQETMPQSLKGHFLLAMPSLVDPNFSRTVTCLSEHNAQGSMGLVINRVHELLTAREIFEELKLEYLPESGRRPIHIGGPVHSSELFMLHGPPFEWQGCFRIRDDLAMSNSLDLLQAVAQGQGPAECLICLGCAGWAPGQLEMELAQNSWITSPVDRGIVFNVPVEERWEAALRSMGIDPALISSTAGHA
jgi:putative transcriptional regulator